VAAWQRLRDLQLGLVPPRALAGVAAIERMLRDFPLTNPQVTINSLDPSQHRSAAGPSCFGAMPACCDCSRWHRGTSMQSLADVAGLSAGQSAWAAGYEYVTLVRATNCSAHLQDDRLQDAMEELRGRFKAVVAAMGLHEGYFPKDAGAGMAF